MDGAVKTRVKIGISVGKLNMLTTEEIVACPDDIAR